LNDKMAMSEQKGGKVAIVGTEAQFSEETNAF
jgi:hypothetical protein